MMNLNLKKAEMRISLEQTARNLKLSHIAFDFIGDFTYLKAPKTADRLWAEYFTTEDASPEADFCRMIAIIWCDSYNRGFREGCDEFTEPPVIVAP